MYIKRIYFSQLPKFEYKDNLHRIPKFVMRILLFLSFIFYGYHTNQNIILSIPYLMQTQGSYAFATWIGQIILASLNLLVFEIVAKFYYGFLRPIQPVSITQTVFLEYVRLGYVVRNVLGGAVKFIFYKSDIAVFGFDSMIGVIVTSLVLALTFIYVMQKYVPLYQKSAFLKCVSIPYIVYQALCVGVVLL